MRFWVVLCLVPLIVAPALAQEPPLFELPEVIVPGRRPQPRSATPASITIITRAELEQIGARTVGEALRLVPEVWIRTYGGFGSLAEPSIRGFGPGQVLVLLDGVPLNSVALGQADLSTLSTIGVERIEVLRGAFGAISGSGAVGGVINIVTSQQAGMLVQTRLGGYGDRQLRVETGRHAFQLALDAAGSAGHRLNSDTAGLTIFGGVNAAPGLRLTLHHFRADVGTPGDAAAPTPFDRQVSARTIAQLQWGGTTAAPVRGRIYYTGEAFSFLSPFGASTYASTVLGGELQREWAVGSGRVVVGGFEFERQTLDATVFGSAINQTASRGAVYLQYDAALSPRALVSAAARIDVHSAYGTTVNPRAGIIYTLSEHTRVRAALGRTFRGPTFLHLFFPGCSNPSLRPETAWSAEVGLEHSVGQTVTTVTAFGAEATDLISGGCPPVNIGAASIRGISADVRGAFGPRLTGSANVTFQQAVDRITGEPLPRVPALVARTVLVYAISPASSVTLLGEYVGPRHDFDFSVFPAAAVVLPGYVDLALRYQMRTSSGWDVTVGVDNVLDASYEVVKGYPVPGRTAFITVSKRY